MSMTYSRLASRSFIIGSRLWPPAIEPGLAAEPLEQPDGVLDAGGAFVLERGGDLHERPPRRTAGVTAVTRLSSSARGRVNATSANY